MAPAAMLQEAARAQAQHQAQQSQVQAQQWQQYTKAQEAEFDRLTTGIPKDVIADASRKLATIARAAGISDQVLAEQARTNPVLNHSAFQALLLDGIRYRRRGRRLLQIRRHDQTFRR